MRALEQSSHCTFIPSKWLQADGHNTISVLNQLALVQLPTPGPRCHIYIYPFKVNGAPTQKWMFQYGKNLIIGAPPGDHD